MRSTVTAPVKHAIARVRRVGPSSTMPSGACSRSGPAPWPPLGGASVAATVSRDSKSRGCPGAGSIPFPGAACARRSRSDIAFATRGVGQRA